jgi:2-polyprenyl-6-methoxyphenol hydroxylase-like FAD-dependent oxidoreductase
VDVPPESEILEMTSDFKYGRVEGRIPTIEQFNSLVKDATGPKYFAEVTDPSWLTYFVVQERMVAFLRTSNRLFLAGDAAHCHSPAGGQGMNMGIQDGLCTLDEALILAHNLAWKLAVVINGQAVDSDKLLDSYTAEVHN